MNISTVPTEAIAGVADLKAGYTLGHADVEILKALAAELLAVREARSVPVKFAGWGLYHAERDEFGSWLKSTPETDKSHAITKHGYVNVKLYTAPPAHAGKEDE